MKGIAINVVFLSQRIVTVLDERIISQKYVLRRRRSFQIGIHNRDNRNGSRFNRQLNLDNPIDT